MSLTGKGGRMARVIAALALLTLFVVPSPAASAKHARVRGPFLLTALPSLGTVTWRCDPAGRPRVRPGFPALALGFRAFSSFADLRLQLRAASKVVRSLKVSPGESVTLPYLRAPTQRLDFVQMTEAGTLRASVRVEFAGPSTATYCYDYLPPRIDVHVSPRR
jgi:hypothetical protein